MTTSWVAIASILVSLVVGVLGQVTAWISLRHSAKQAQDDRTWHYKVELYIDLLNLLSDVNPDDFTVHDGNNVVIGRGPDLRKRIADLRLEGRMVALASPVVRKFWDLLQGAHGTAAIIGRSSSFDPGDTERLVEAIQQAMRSLETNIRKELGQKEYPDDLRNM